MKFQSSKAFSKISFWTYLWTQWLNILVCLHWYYSWHQRLHQAKQRTMISIAKCKWWGVTVPWETVSSAALALMATVIVTATLWSPLCHPSLGTAPGNVLLTVTKTSSTNCHPLLQEESPVMKSIRSGILLNFEFIINFSSLQTDILSLMYFRAAEDGSLKIELKNLKSYMKKCSLW